MEEEREDDAEGGREEPFTLLARGRPLRHGAEEARRPQFCGHCAIATFSVAREAAARAARKRTRGSAVGAAKAASHGWTGAVLDARPPSIPTMLLTSERAPLKLFTGAGALPGAQCR